MLSCKQTWHTAFHLHLLVHVLAEGATRVYYLGIREVDWNYAPLGKNTITGQSIANDMIASSFLQPAENRIGSIYRKSVYKQYLDETYTSEIPKPSWLGFLGPIIRAEVGDTIIVHLKNFGRRPFTIHPHGVFYKKDSEGSLYPDESSSQDLKKDDAIPPGRNHTYTWTVPEDHGPTDDDPACLTWIYHSHVDAAKDIATGLIGPLLICREGTLKSVSQRRHDADLDFFLMFSVVDENESWHLDQNIASFCGDPSTVDEEDEGFRESNKMHAINGKLYANLPGLTMYEGDWVNWYLLGMGQEIDIHTVHFHAETFLYRSGKTYRADVADLFPGTFEVVEMLVGNPGTWLLHCHVADHIHAGMETLFTVFPKHDSVLLKTNSYTETPPEDEDNGHHFVLFGSKLAHSQVEATIIFLAVTGVLLFLIACTFLGVIIYLQRQKRLRRNRRSILDEGFKLMSTKKH
uniref:ferroxidase n=1 Tax=Podarcis muralis TaxID=64176 RepID=A0A670JYB4_PODMU